MRVLRAIVPALSLTLGFIGSLPAAETPPAPTRSPLAISPFPAVTDYAAQHGLAVEGIEFAPDADTAQPGDQVVYLLELQQPDGQRQWLVRLTAGRDDPKTSIHSIPADTIYTSTGLELRYTHTPAALDVEFIGPFATDTGAGASVAIRRGRAIVSAESLRLGLERYCESAPIIAGRQKAAGLENSGYYAVFGGSRRPKAEAIESGRKAAAAFGLTPEEERLTFSVYFALRSFYQAASEIPACRDVLEQVLQKPSLWSIAGHLGLNATFKYGWQGVRILPTGRFPVSTPVYVLPVSLALNGQPALEAQLAVTSTRPPLRNCAGIVALVAGHPTDASKLVFMRLLSARTAKPADDLSRVSRTTRQ